MLFHVIPTNYSRVISTLNKHKETQISAHFRCGNVGQLNNDEKQRNLKV